MFFFLDSIYKRYIFVTICSNMDGPRGYHTEWSKPTPVSDSLILGWCPRSYIFYKLQGSMDAAGPGTTLWVSTPIGRWMSFHADETIHSTSHILQRRDHPPKVYAPVFKEHSARCTLQDILTECHVPSKIWEKIGFGRIICYPSLFSHTLKYNNNNGKLKCGYYTFNLNLSFYAH